MEIIRKGKVSKPTEFGKLVKIQEAENQIITHYAVCRERPADSTWRLEAVPLHQQRLGRAPELLAGDAGFTQRRMKGRPRRWGKRVSIPNRSTQSAARRKQRWFRQGQKMEDDCDGRISVLKRRHELKRKATSAFLLKPGRPALESKTTAIFLGLSAMKPIP